MPPERHYPLQEPDDHGRPAKKPPRPRGASAKRDWTCPNCGAEFKDSHALVCLECGYDIKSLKIVKTVTGAVEVDEEGEPVEDGDDVLEIVRPRRLAKRFPLDPWLPLVIGGAALLVLVLGHLLGAEGLFHLGPEQTLDLSVRAAGLLRFTVFVALFFGCALVGLLFLNYLLESRIGDMPLALLRLGAIAVAIRLPAFLRVGGRATEWTLEAIFMAAIYVALALVFFRLAWRHIATMGVTTLLAFVGAWAFAHVIVWVT